MTEQFVSRADIIATSPWTRENRSSPSTRVVLRLIDSNEYAVHTQEHHVDKTEFTNAEFTNGFSCKFNVENGSRKRALQLAFIVFQTQAAFRILHSPWVDSPLAE